MATVRQTSSWAADWTFTQNRSPNSRRVERDRGERADRHADGRARRVERGHHDDTGRVVAKV
jgi:hypothetical protein